MAHFAKLGKGSKVVAVHVVNNDIATTEQAGVDFLNTLHGTKDVWKQTSYNTRGGIHILDGTPFRKNYAGIGDTYDEVRNAFYERQPYPSWTLNETICQWEAPIAQPSLTAEERSANQLYKWNESTEAWDLTDLT